VEFWFQAYGAVMGMDWHSFGITTSVLGALKRGINPRFSELGLIICGGRGRHSIRTPDELRAFSQRTGLDGDTLARTSRLAALFDPIMLFRLASPTSLRTAKSRLAFQFRKAGNPLPPLFFAQSIVNIGDRSGPRSLG
jgi:Protein of unknown function (DUF763)